MEHYDLHLSLVIISVELLCSRHTTRSLVQVKIYRRLWIGRDDHLDQSEAYDIS